MQPDWVGRRVALRYGGESSAPPYRDVVGELVELTATQAVVASGSGTREVPLDRIVAARIVGPSPRDILTVEEVCARGWRAAETTWQQGWLLRADHGFSRRANSALPLRPLLGSLDEVVAETGEWYAARGLPLTISCPLPARRALDQALADRGFPSEFESHVMVARLSALPSVPEPVEITPSPSSHWLAGYHYRGRAQLPDAALGVLTRHERVAFATLSRGDAVVGVARGTVDAGWLGTSAVEVATPARRSGVATSLLGALRDWAVREHGATRGYVQVETANAAATALYLGLGYWPHHTYRYRIDPATTQPG